MKPCYSLDHRRIVFYVISLWEISYEWDEYGEAFLCMSGLKRHKQIHSWGKPFECIECGKTVCWSTNLILHSLIHTGQKPYECGACGKAFSCSSSLRHHQRMHSDSSPPSVTEDRRPLTTTHASLTLSELLLGKDSLNVTCEGNFCHKKCLLQDLIIYTKEKLHKSLDCKTNKQTNKQTNKLIPVI